MKMKQSLAGYIRQHLSELEARLDVGIRQEVIIQELETTGYKTSLQIFRNCLYRARIRAKAREKKSPSPVPAKVKKSGVGTEKPAPTDTPTPPDQASGFKVERTADVDTTKLF
jgi:hypothetical protein